MPPWIEARGARPCTAGLHSASARQEFAWPRLDPSPTWAWPQRSVRANRCHGPRGGLCFASQGVHRHRQAVRGVSTHSDTFHPWLALLIPLSPESLGARSVSQESPRSHSRVRPQVTGTSSGNSDLPAKARTSARVALTAVASGGWPNITPARLLNRPTPAGVSSCSPRALQVASNGTRQALGAESPILRRPLARQAKIDAWPGCST